MIKHTARLEGEGGIKIKSGSLPTLRKEIRDAGAGKHLLIIMSEIAW